MSRLIGLAVLLAVLPGCGAPQNPSCDLTYPVEIGPLIATADHTASPPGNQAQFRASVSPYSSAPGCAVPEVIALVYATWSLSDPIDAQISSAANATNGLATCVNLTPDPITVTAAYTANGATQTRTATLTCN
jgi:hypothetical protein